MREKFICGCASSSWAKGIGWLQIIGASALIIAITWTIFVGPVLSQTRDESAFEQMQKNNMIMALMLLLAALSFIMAIVLLQGTYAKNSRQIQAWMVFAIITISLLSVMTLLEFLIESEISLTICTLHWILFQIICLSAVNTHRKEIEEWRKTLIPVKA